MKWFSGNEKGNSKTPRGSVLLYIAGSVILIIAAASLIMNIFLFNQTVSQYVAQGYPSDVVMKQLVPVQLLPGLFEAVGLYAGIGLLLLGAGFLHTKVSMVLQSVMITDHPAEVSAEVSTVDPSANLQADQPGVAETEIESVDIAPDPGTDEQNSKDSDS